jgi:hypothetical protein
MVMPAVPVPTPERKRRREASSCASPPCAGGFGAEARWHGSRPLHGARRERVRDRRVTESASRGAGSGNHKEGITRGATRSWDPAAPPGGPAGSWPAWSRRRSRRPPRPGCAQPVKTPEQQARADQQHHRQGHLTDDQHLLPPAAALAARFAPEAFLPVAVSGAQGGQQREADRSSTAACARSSGHTRGLRGSRPSPAGSTAAAFPRARRWPTG